MEQVRCWLYKWNTRGRFHEGLNRDWDAVLSVPPLSAHFQGFGFESSQGKKLYNEARSGEVVICYQTEKKAAVGLCLIVEKATDAGRQCLRLTPALKFPKPVRLHELKQEKEELRGVKALSQGLVQSFYSLSASDASALLEACGVSTQQLADIVAAFRQNTRQAETATAAWTDDELQSAGAGYGNVDSNQKVERAAIAVASGHYEAQGWSVRSVESENRGYDLHCVRADRQIHVEVKGIAGTSVAFIITDNELRLARCDPQFRLCVVTMALSQQPSLREWTGPEVADKFSIRPLQHVAKLRE